MTRYLFLLLGLFTLSTAPAGAETDPVEVTLHAAKEGAEEGELLVGVNFKMQPGWHVYWKYPGEIGKPTQVRLALPEGYQEQPFHWPLPHVFKIPSSPDGYGYEGEAMIVTEVKAPVTKGPSAKSSQDIKVEAVVKYLACSAKACLPGSKELSTKAVLGQSGSLATLEQAKGRLLAEKVSDSSLAQITVQGAAAEGSSTPLKALLRWDKQPHSAEWFPVPPASVKVKNAKLSSNELTFEVELKEYPREVVEIPSLFVIASAEGKRSAVEQVLKIPVVR